MASTTLSFVMGIIGNVISILVFASPIKTFIGIVKKKSTENYKGIPYVTTLLSTSLWTFYGVLKPDGLLVTTVNAAGVVFQLSYVVLFIIFAPSHNKVTTMKLVGLFNVVFYGSVVVVALLAIHGSLRLTFVGILCAALTIGMYASPLAAMKNVIKTESVEYMPFLLSFFLFLNAGIWSAYAILVKDIYIGVPNGIGFVLGLAQLILYGMYKKKSKSRKSTEMREEDGSANLVEMRMKGGDDYEKNIGGIIKGLSLPKPTIDRQYSVQNILRSLSYGPYDFHPVLDEDVENAKNDHP